jgi:hypothetical protein
MACTMSTWERAVCGRYGEGWAGQLMNATGGWSLHAGATRDVATGPRRSVKQRVASGCHAYISVAYCVRVCERQ